MHLSQSKCSLEKHFIRSQISSKNSKRFWSFHLKRATEVNLPFKDEGQGTSYYTQGNLTLSVNTDFGNKFGWFIKILYYKMWQILLQNATSNLSRNATKVYYKMHQIVYHKMQQFYYKFRQLLQNVLILLQNATVIRTCDVYYKMCLYIHQSIKIMSIEEFKNLIPLY